MAYHGPSRTRTPLAELPVVSPDGTIQHTSPTPGQTVAPPQRGVLTPRLIDSPRANIPDSILTPTLSPDEIAIRQRARRRPPIIWSPDHGGRARIPSPMKTPPKNGTSMTLRSSPRKRSLMQDFADVPSTSGFSTPTRRLQQMGRMSVGDSPGTSSKRSKLEEAGAMNVRNESIPLTTLLKGYSQDQLIGIIGSILAKNEMLESVVRRELPLPDITPLNTELGRIKKNIYVSVPNLKLFSRTDGHGFLRAATHLATFKQAIHNQAQTLSASRHWDALLDYVLMAWTHVRETPVYENTKHNATRRYCFKLLAHHATSALKHGGMGLGTERVARFQQRLPGMIEDCAEISECSKCVEYIMKGL